MSKQDRDAVEAQVENTKLTKLLINELNKDSDKTGKMAWNLATDADNPTDVREFISTGSTLLDYIISNRINGGVPVGKLTEIHGEEGSGKSLLCAHIIAETQRRGGLAVYIDTENAANPEFMARLGVNINEMVYLQPSAVEDVGESIVRVITMARLKAPNRLVTILWDGIAGTPTKVELTGEFDLNMNTQLEKSKVLSKMMRMITETLGKERICLVFTNQLKTKIGVMYGDPMTTPGGKAVPYHSSVRIRLTSGEKHKDDGKGGTGDVYGISTTAKVIKNRCGPPLRKCKFDILFSSGVDDVGSWFEKLHELKEIEKADGWCYLSSLPSGKIEEKGANKGTDRGMKFRESRFSEFVTTDPKVKAHCLKLLEKHMIVKYDTKPFDAEADPESLMEAETIQAAVVASTTPLP